MTINQISNEEIIDAINKISPTGFENLTLDIARAVGFRNIVWRTPGADGGRDIQAEEMSTDLSGSDNKNVWYIECKHYSSSVDWPTVWRKVSYADSHRADYLLLVTNSQPSPACETEIKRWNDQRRKPLIRVWRGYDIPTYLRLHQNIAISHGIIQSPQYSSILSAQPAQILSKMIQSAYGSWIFGSSPEHSLTAASTLAELLNQRLSDISAYGRFVLGEKINNVKDWHWCTVDGAFTHQEDISFRAIIAAIRYITSAASIKCTIVDEVIKIRSISGKSKMSAEAETFIKPILELAMCENFKITGDDEIEVSLRGQNGKT